MINWYDKVNIIRPDLSGYRRIIAVSDIHANLDYFQHLLEMIQFGKEDALVIVGDFLEKGERSLDTLHLVLKLVEQGNTFAVAGNCDAWTDIVEWLHNNDDMRKRWTGYMAVKKSGILYEMFHSMGIEIAEDTDVRQYLPALHETFWKELKFLEDLPTVLETKHYIFVHGGISPYIPLEEQRQGDVMKMDNFRGKGWSFDKWVIVGHWPVMLYIYDHCCANPIIDRDRKIISIDGGCVLKDDGQLNALIIPGFGSEEFTWEWYDPFPVKIALDGQKASDSSYYIRWGDSEVEVLESGEEFSRCRHVRTGYEMDILTKYLFRNKEGKLCTNDCSDYELEVRPGDEVSIIEETSRGYYVKNKGTSGWYRGRIQEE